MALPAVLTATAAQSRTGSTRRFRRRRCGEAIAFVAVWMAAGFLLPVDSDAYLLLGIPLTIAFQVVVRRRPLLELVAPMSSKVTWDVRTITLAVALAGLPAGYVVGSARSHDWVAAGWYLAAAFGAACAAFALRAGTLAGALRSAALPIAIGTTGMALVYSALHVIEGVPVDATAAVATVLKYAALYFPACFLLEEVSFRGALDAHVHEGGDRRGWRSAVLVSALWGLWHLPVTHSLPLHLQAVELVVVHVLLGVPLSLAWRRSRNLAGPALAHAVNDAVRNAFMIGL